MLSYPVYDHHLPSKDVCLIHTYSPVKSFDSHHCMVLTTERLNYESHCDINLFTYHYYHQLWPGLCHVITLQYAWGHFHQLEMHHTYSLTGKCNSIYSSHSHSMVVRCCSVSLICISTLYFMFASQKQLLRRVFSFSDYHTCIHFHISGMC